MAIRACAPRGAVSLASTGEQPVGLRAEAGSEEVAERAGSLAMAIGVVEPARAMSVRAVGDKVWLTRSTWCEPKSGAWGATNIAGSDAMVVGRDPSAI